MVVNNYQSKTVKLSSYGASCKNPTVSITGNGVDGNCKNSVMASNHTVYIGIVCDQGIYPLFSNFLTQILAQGPLGIGICLGLLHAF